MKSLVSFFFLLLIKSISRLLYRFEVGWPNNDPNVPWNEIRLIIFLNHTSLLEFLYIGILPVSFLRRLSKRMIAPGADKTLNRPIVGFFFKLFSPGIISISRKRDDTWSHFMDLIYEDSVIIILPEGRMKRKSGLDLEGNKMTVRGGVADVLTGLHKGQVAFAYSGGLHHVHVPDEKSFHFFKTLKINLDTMQIADYKNSFGEPVGSEAWKKKLLEDLQHRLETKIPVL